MPIQHRPPGATPVKRTWRRACTNVALPAWAQAELRALIEELHTCGAAVLPDSVRVRLPKAGDPFSAGSTVGVACALALAYLRTKPEEK